MKKKTGKKILVVGLFVASLAVGYKLIENSFRKEPTTKNNSDKALAFYLEGDDGEYTLNVSNEFPTDGYILNTEKSTCTNGGTLSQDAETKVIRMSTSRATKCNLYFEKETLMTLANGLKSNVPSITDYNSGDKGEMFAFTHPATAQTEALTDYRYIGANPNNYIDFNDETWRIIGVFTVETESGSKEQLIKIIRDESIGNLAWDSSSNEWSTASLKTLLNGDYYNQTGSYTSTAAVKGLSATARNQIANVKWYLGGSSTYQNLGGPDYYAFERGTTVYSGRSINITAKVGLMYPSDYIYTYANGVENTCYTDGYNCDTGTPANGWLFNNVVQWSVSPRAGYADYAFSVYSIGYVDVNNVYNASAVRPTVFLASGVAITGGDGSAGNHYKLG